MVYKKLLKRYCTTEQFNELTLIVPELTDLILEESLYVCNISIVKYYTDKEIQSEENMDGKCNNLSFVICNEITWKAKGNKTNKYKVKPKKPVSNRLKVNNSNAKVQEESKLCIDSYKHLTEELIKKESHMSIIDKEVQYEEIPIPKIIVRNNNQQQVDIEYNGSINPQHRDTNIEHIKIKE
jgi:hypothetical protein